jgi:acyl-CoA thioester hydrolase
MNALLTARCTLVAQFYDVDPMNVVWHGHYLRFFEEGRGALLTLLDYNYEQMQASGYLWPVVDFRIKYIRPIKLHQKFSVEAGLVEYENRLKIEYQLQDVNTLEILTKAHSIQVAVQACNQEMLYASPEIFLVKVRKVLE